MRLWSIHPAYLDRQGLVAAWREGLLARAVLRGVTHGYRHHPQLDRFRAQSAPVSAINCYLAGLAAEARSRGYRFDRSRVGPVRKRARIAVSCAQVEFELTHLRAKLRARAPGDLERLPGDGAIRAHPLFRIREGPVEPWERGAARQGRGAGDRTHQAGRRGRDPRCAA